MEWMYRNMKIYESSNKLYNIKVDKTNEEERTLEKKMGKGGKERQTSLLGNQNCIHRGKSSEA